MPFVGWDYFTRKCGEYDYLKCAVCDSVTEVKRDCYGPTSSIEAQFGSKRAYDSFCCPHTEEKWHKQVLRLRQEIEKTPSLKLEKIYLEEIEQILETKTPTKELKDYF